MSGGAVLNTRELWEKDKAHFLHPWQHFDSFKRDGSLVIARGEGAYIYDSEGKKYLDGIGGMWCVNVGYGRQEIIEAMAEQAQTLAYYSTFYDTTNPPAVELATKLAAISPGPLKISTITFPGLQKIRSPKAIST